MPTLVWTIDDDKNIRHVLKTMCNLIGYEVEDFSSPTTAGQALLAGQQPKVIFLDINMPDVNGFQFLEFLRSKERWLDIVVIMVSSESQDVLVEKAISLGADGYVFKPISFDELKMSIRTASKRRASLRKK